MNNTNIDDLIYLFEVIKGNGLQTAHKPMLQNTNDDINKSYIQYWDWKIRFIKGCIAVEINNKIKFMCFTHRELLILIKCYDNIEVFGIDKENENENDK